MTFGAVQQLRQYLLCQAAIAAGYAIAFSTGEDIANGYRKSGRNDGALTEPVRGGCSRIALGYGVVDGEVLARTGFSYESDLRSRITPVCSAFPGLHAK